jgi:hypothetical protein
MEKITVLDLIEKLSTLNKGDSVAIEIDSERRGPRRILKAVIRVGKTRLPLEVIDRS